MSNSGLLLDPVYKQHTPGEAHPERPERLDAITAALERDGAVKASTRIEPRLATDDELAAVHSREYIALAKKEITGGRRILSTGDTDVTPGSLDVALRAAGGVLNAVDAIFNRGVKNAFCAVRPPGHMRLRLAEWDSAYSTTLRSRRAMRRANSARREC